jgi:hypothetical protein
VRDRGAWQAARAPYGSGRSAEGRVLTLRANQRKRAVACCWRGAFIKEDAPKSIDFHCGNVEFASVALFGALGSGLGGNDRRGNYHTDKRKGNQQIMHGESPCGNGSFRPHSQYRPKPKVLKSH